MIAKMRKLNLAALSYDRDGILNALERTNAVEIKEHAEAEGTVSLPVQGEELRAYLSALESALGTLEKAAESLPKSKKVASDAVPYAEFAAAAEKREEMDSLVSRINAIIDTRNACRADGASVERMIAAAKPYAKAALPFDAYADTLHTRTRLGLVPAPAWGNLQKQLDVTELVGYEIVKNEDGVLLTLTAHKSVFAEVEGLLVQAGFSSCPYTESKTGAQQLAELEERLAAIQAKDREAEEALLALTSEIRSLKIYCDYVGFQLEKAEASALMRGTERTFFLEAFVPAEQEEKVKKALENTATAVWYEFSEPGEDEQIPTLMKNNKVVANFETVTNMYSPPNAREIDPNTVMAFFYSLFMGFIMADIGYGVMMLLGGGVLYFINRKKQGGIKSLAGVFAVCGVFTIFWGVLFNSLFGISVLPFYVMPNARDDMWSLAGISLPAILVFSLLLGIVQLMAGYLCKAAQYWHRGDVWGGIFEGVTWALFSLGVELAVIGLIETEGFQMPQIAFTESFRLSALVVVGGGVAVVSLLIAVLTAGRRQKFFGKVTKGFGALYGLIGYFTDVLSYLRLYGLMLTGAVIAQLISQYAVVGDPANNITGFLQSGNVLLIVLGVLLMIVGHVFNLAIGLLGAYIHTARLQYVEFFGRFYEGEGRLFAPLGSQRKYITLEQK